MRPRRTLRVMFLTMGVAACLMGSTRGATPQAPAVTAVSIADPLYLDPSYYDAYYGYWTDMEAPGAEAVA